VIRLVATVAAAALALAGSGAAATRPPAIQDGGTVVVGTLNSTPGSLDPDHPGGSGQADGEIWRAMCETLYDVAPNGATVPLLASAPSTISKDKLTITIPLRKGILFNDGTPFNAAAVATTFERDIDPRGTARSTILGQVTSATASGPYTVQLHLSSPNTALLAGLTNEHIMSPTQLANLGSNFSNAPVCVGAFMFQSQVPGQSVTLVKSPYYYDKADVHLDKLVFQYEPSDLAAAAALESGDIQVLDIVPRDELKSVEDNGFRIIGRLSFGGVRIGINLGNVNGTGAPYSNTGSEIASSPQLREAFEMAIDRKTLDRVVYGGLDVPGCTPLSPAAVEWYAATNVPCTPYDPAQARKLVQASGIANPTVQMDFPGDVQDTVLAEFLQAEEKAVGINLALNPMDSTTLTSHTNAGTYETDINSNASQVKADPDWIFVLFLGGAVGGPSNIYGYGNPSVVRDLHNGRKAVSPQARAVDYRAAQAAVMADRPVIYLEHIVNRAAFTNKLTGVDIRADQNVRVAFAAYKASST
jgi:peptide/nickel transport system substrate-binding protein